MNLLRGIFGVVLLAALVASPAQVRADADSAGFGEPESEPLVMGEPAFVLFDESKSKFLRLEVDEPGLLALALTAQTGTDAMVLVADDLGQVLQNGHLDWDPTDAPGGEYGAVALAKPGVYFVVLRSWEGRASGDLLATFNPLGGFEIEVDPQGRPDAAEVVKVGVPIEQSADMDAGDHRDWFKFEARRNGVVSFRTRVPNGSETDLGLEVFTPPDFAWSVAEGDFDMGEHMGNESVEFAVSEGEVVYVRVTAWYTDGESPYTMDARWQD
ncbi:MAG: hypothetical protein AAF593_04695 [Planctomycetota bacterium]